MDSIPISDLGFELANAFSTPTLRDSPSTNPIDTLTNREVEEDILQAINEVVAEDEDFSSITEDESDRENSSGLAELQPSRLKPVTVQLPVSTLIYPRTVCANYEPPVKLFKEWQAVENLLNAEPSQKDEDFIEFELDQFSCYVDTTQYDSDMRALHSHATLTGKATFYFDGILRTGNVECYVQRVAFEEIPLGNYGKEEPTVGDQMWIRSTHNRRREIYYKLGAASREYTRYHEKFVWVADLAKHVVDFCAYLLEKVRNVSFHCFKKDFIAWLKATHKTHKSFQKWYAQRNSDDFRQSIVANSPYIRKEIWSMFSSKQLRRILIFDEISKFNAIPFQGGLPSKDECPKTIVTPYIYSCFSHLESGSMLKPVEPSISTGEAVERSWPQSQSKEAASVQEGMSGTAEGVVSHVQPGHLISTPPDGEEYETKWRTGKADKKWYGLVQKVHLNRRGQRQFDVTWLYQPEDTPCCSMKYPWGNELFLSNHCTCEGSAKVREDQILGVHSVEWHGGPGTRAEFFVRQTYLSDERRFVTLQEAAHRRCSHGGEATRDYHTGDTVLVKLPESCYLEPCELLGYLDRASQVRLRRFKRRSDFTSGCPPNELVYTADEVCCDVNKIATRCIVRCYSPQENVPMPYNQRGVGNAFFVTHRLLQNGLLQPWNPGEGQPTFRQGFDPTKDVKKLRALDLFSGFGNFGRGLEDGGAIEAKWANDIWNVAAHTYKYNSRNPRSINPFLGSIDDLLRSGMEGKFSNSVPRPDEVDVILGGSPCQGFSLITADKTTDRQKKNRSMVASFASAVDFWRPQWGILENVRTIVKSSKDITEDCFSQLICALVGMGYQAQIILGDAWSYGAPQSRVRVFLCFAAPGLRLPQPPYPSHSNPRGKSSGGLGKMTNNEPYVTRQNRLTAFKYVTASEATADLPDIYDGHTDTCLNFPDHRLMFGITTGRGLHGRRKQIRTIPAGPYGVNFAMAYHGRKGAKIPDLFPHEAKVFPLGTHRTQPISKAWGRQHPHQLFGTITTYCHYADARTGGSLMHWNQPRPLSIMEARRAQGIPDGEVLCGTPRDQWKLVGNAVARQVSIALALMLREAWAGTLYEDSIGATETENALPPPSASLPNATIIQEQEPQSEVYIVIDDDDNDDDDDDEEHVDEMSLAGLASQADAGVSSSTRATSLNEVQDPLSGGENIVASIEMDDMDGMDGSKRPLSKATFSSEQLPTSPAKKRRMVIPISDDEEDELAITHDVALQTPTCNSLTVVRLSSEESC